MPATPEPAEIDGETERRVAADLFNLVWRLLDQEERTADDDDAMVHAAHASCHHWSRVGTAENRVRGEWQCSRVYAVLRRPEPALHHAQRCVDLCRGHGIGDFDLAFAYEAMARAHAVAEDYAAAATWLRQAEEAAAHVVDAEDREILLSDIATIPMRPR